MDSRRNQPARFAQRTPCRNARQHRPADSAHVRHRRLLGLPARARSREPGARGDDRPAAGERRPRPHAADEGLAGLVAEQLRPQVVADATTHPRFKYFSEAGEDPYRSFLGVPLIDRGLLQGVLVVQTIEPRAFSADDVRHADDGRHAAGADRQRGAHARDSSSRRRISGWRRSRRTCGGAGTTTPTSLFRELDPVLWRELDHNPIALLQQIPIDAARRARVASSRCTAASTTPTAGCRSTCTSTHTWGARHAGVLWARPVAYFSAEFGLHESVPIYSGGLGILAGDHIKSASDLGIPLVGVGLYYDQGYFTQRLDHDGWQQEDYIDVDSSLLPIEPATDASGEPVTISDRDAHRARIVARVWKLAVGRNTLLLLDSNVEGNQPEDRELTSRLYGGDDRVRIRQELLLGVGGVRALAALGISPGVVHLNEGHSAFAALELVAQRMATEGIDADEALAPRLRAGRVHHPHAGAGRPRPLLADAGRRAPRPAARRAGHRATTICMALGRVNPARRERRLLHDGARAEAVAPRQRRVVAARPGLARDVDAALPGRIEEQVPIGHITNGVHVRTWLAPQMRQLYDRHLGPDWTERMRASPASGKRIDDVDDGELWETHQTLKARLIDVGAAAGRAAGRARAASRAEFVDAAAARAQPRRADDRLRAPLRHLQAGQPDPAGSSRRSPRSSTTRRCRCSSSSPARRIRTTSPARRCCSEIARLMRDPRFAGKLVFIEDYDINVGRHLVQGVDVWLNNPRRPLEACGTSGQKVVLNGGLNLSILDGWWAEAYDGLNGFAIGTRRDAHVDRACTTRATPRRCSTCCATKSFRCTTTATRRPAARVDRADEARHPHARLALQRRSHGDGLRAEGVHSGRRRHEQRNAILIARLPVELYSN